MEGGAWRSGGVSSWVDRGGLEEGGVVRSFSFLSPACFFFSCFPVLFFFFLPLLVVISTPSLIQRPTGERNKTGKARAGRAHGFQA